MVTGMRCRAIARRCPAVQTRWEPQMTTGRIGALPDTDIRTAPLLNGSSSKDREMVVSGKTPTISPWRRLLTAAR